MEKVVTENTQYTAQLMEAQNKMTEMYTKLHSKETEVSTYQDMLEQSQGQFIVLEKKYTKAKKIIKGTMRRVMMIMMMMCLCLCSCCDTLCSVPAVSVVFIFVLVLCIVLFLSLD